MLLYLVCFYHRDCNIHYAASAITATGGKLPNQAALVDKPTFSAVASTATSSSSSTPSSQLSSELPLAALTKVANTEEASQAVSIGPHSPPIPKILVDHIRRYKFIELSKLLPSRLGIPQPTLIDVLALSSSKQSPKQISSIEEWVMCFNTYIAVIASKQPERVEDLLAYSSIILKASKDFNGLPWLKYDSCFRKEASIDHCKSWAVVDASAWTLHFSNAEPKSEVHLSAKESRYQPYRKPPICINFNNNKYELPTQWYRHVCTNCEKPIHTDGQCPEPPRKAKTGSFRPHQQ